MCQVKIGDDRMTVPPPIDRSGSAPSVQHSCRASRAYSARVVGTRTLLRSLYARQPL